MAISSANICDEGDYVLIRARVARVGYDTALVCIEHCRDGGPESTPYSLVVERASIAAVELTQPANVMPIALSDSGGDFSREPAARAMQLSSNSRPSPAVPRTWVLSKHVYQQGPDGCEAVVITKPVVIGSDDAGMPVSVPVDFICGRPATDDCHFQEGE